MTTCNINPNILRWIEMVERGEVNACKDQFLLVAHVRRSFAAENIYTDAEQLDKYLGLGRYFPYDRIFEWQQFCLALHLCTYWTETGLPRWPDLFMLIGRGAGKDGYIALESMCLTSPYNPVKRYDVDICANTGEQATRPMMDVIEVMESPEYFAKFKRHFYWTQEKVVGIKNRGTIKGRTNNPKSRDGMRSGEVVFNEIHQYQNYANIKVFITGKGKVPHPRELYATTNGDVREGPLDEMLDRSMRILNDESPDNGFLPFICRLDDKKEAENPDMWEKANPSLPYLPHLRTEIESEFLNWKENPATNPDFMTKRMNLPQSAADIAVTDYANIKATNRELPDMRGWSCVAGIDYTKVTDLASVNLRFKRDGLKYDLNHSWLCLQSNDLRRIKAPWREWADAGLLTLVDDVEIHPSLIANWLLERGAIYDIKKLALDNYRYALMAEYLNQVGFDAKERKNVKLIRPSDIMTIVPVIESDFANQRMVWGDNPVLRWGANNTKVVASSKKIGSDTGNRYYAKIEGKSRKTDPFMALVASAVLDNELQETGSVFDDLPVIVL